MSEASRFLEKNGFTKELEKVYGNGKCDVKINDGYYTIFFYNVGSMHSDNLSIYWLIGVLTYYELIDKNYKQ